MHIIDEIRFLRSCSRDLNLEGLKVDPVMQRAFLRSLEVIGEAVKNLSEDLRENHPEVEWRKIAGLRDRLIHHYFEVDWQIVWDVVTGRLPSLEEKLVTIVESITPDDN
ncbi:MAG: DUF86 domain-containing protein [Thermoplasmata archaeon]|nr:DUF86 domain-containing protein [Thermoplasmata archaeon]